MQPVEPQHESRELDHRRLRSAGPLSERELAIARMRGLALAYDPVQIGWVLADCIDDFDPEVDLQAATSAIDSELRHIGIEAMIGSLRSSARSRLREMDRRVATQESTDASIWALAESLVEERAGLAPDLRLALLRALQAEAHAILQSLPAFREGREKRRHRALVDGHDLVLRAWRDDEAVRFRALLDDPRIWRYLPEDRPDPLTEDLARDLIAVSNAQPHHEVRAIEYEGRPVGQVRMLFGHRGATTGPGSQKAGREAEISYWIGSDHWGHGIAGKAIRLYTLLCFRSRPLESIVARVDAENVASLRALARAGYRDEGDLAARLDGAGRTRILRCYRAEYLDEAQRRLDDPPRRARSVSVRPRDAEQRPPAVGRTVSPN